MSDSARETAEKIMALVDEYPSGPLSFERRQVIDEVETLIACYTKESEDELDISFALGLDEGRRQAEDESAEEISNLEEIIDELREEVKEEYNRGYDEGFETASAASS